LKTKFTIVKWEAYGTNKKKRCKLKKKKSLKDLIKEKNTNEKKTLGIK
jgi:hypothetical protein